MSAHRKLSIDLSRWCDMRQEEVRHALDGAQGEGKTLSKADHLALHRASFLAGARAMAGVTHGELAALIESEAAAAQACENVVFLSSALAQPWPPKIRPTEKP